jgi:hypothetical protein
MDHAQAGRLVVITSQPCLGATTLLQFGIAPALKDVGFITVFFQDWQGRNFNTQLMELIASSVREQADPSFLSTAEALSQLVSRVARQTGRPVALILDQFEDYLRCHLGTDLADEFDAELSHAISGHECQVVIALQDHAVFAFGRLEQYVPNLLGSHVSLGPLDEAAARELVAGTGQEKGLQFEPAVIDALVTAPIVAYKGGVHPFYLTAGIKRLIDAGLDKKWTAVTASMLEIYGGPDRLILESLDLKLSRLNPNQTELFFRWCNVLLSPKDERLAVSLTALADYAGKLNRFALTTLPILIEEGILRSVETAEARRFEIARDALPPIIRDWWLRREAMLVARTRARFRIRSMSLAVGSIVLIYVAYLLLSIRK